MNYNKELDFLVWYFILFKVQLFRFSKKKLGILWKLLKSMTFIMKDKSYSLKIDKFKKKLDSITSKSDLMIEIKNLRKSIEKDDSYFHFDIDIFKLYIQAKITEKAKLEKKKITWKNPSLWGPPLWLYLHLLTFTCSTKDREIAYENHIPILKLILENLPCKKCCNESKMYLKKQNIKIFPLEIYFIDFHNSVNIRLQKQIMICKSFQKIQIQIIHNIYEIMYDIIKFSYYGNFVTI